MLAGLDLHLNEDTDYMHTKQGLGLVEGILLFLLILKIAIQ